MPVPFSVPFFCSSGNISHKNIYHKLTVVVEPEAKKQTFGEHWKDSYNQPKKETRKIGKSPLFVY
jgi:hypothetical protein